jgi:hypothetical protein
MLPYLAYFWWGYSRRPRRVSRLSGVQALSITILSVIGLPFFIVGSILFIFWLMAAVLGNPNIVLLVFLLAICGLFVKK